MTNEEAKKMLKAKLDCMNRFTTGCDLYCTRNDCDNCNLCYEQGHIGEQKEAIELAIKVLEQTRWIPVSEGLPEDGQKVLVTTQNGNIIDVDTCLFYHASAFWKHFVIAWMPLLKSYKAESEEN